MHALNTYMYVQLSSRSPGAPGHETRLARYELLGSFLCAKSPKDSQTSKSSDRMYRSAIYYSKTIV